MDARLRAQWERTRASLLSRRDALMAEVREIDQMLGAGPRATKNGGMCGSLRQLVHNTPGQTVRELSEASGIPRFRAHALIFHMDAKGDLRVDRSVKPHRVYPAESLASSKAVP